MPQAPIENILHYLLRVCAASSAGKLTDRQLLERFQSLGEETVCNVLIQRHGRMVYSVAQRALGNAHDAEDVFQATFLVMARRLHSIGGKKSVGGWLHGDDLPLERRFSVGGIGTIPGFDFRKYEPGTVDVSQCSNGGQPPPGNPAQCERLALAQLEYRNELRSSFFDFLNARPIRLRGIGFTVRPTAVAFVDAGRGWLVGQPSGTLVYSNHSFPRFGTFRTDVGLGLDLGIIGVYAAKAVSSPKEPANVFLRVHRRF